MFREFAVGDVFARSRVVVKLFEHGAEFVSRSEARRLLSGLDAFREVVLDFTSVVSVGQGFVDEVFRVWAAAHPDTRLSTENVAPAVAFMLARVVRPD